LAGVFIEGVIGLFEEELIGADEDSSEDVLKVDASFTLDLESRETGQLSSQTFSQLGQLDLAMQHGCLIGYSDSQVFEDYLTLHEYRLHTFTQVNDSFTLCLIDCSAVFAHVFVQMPVEYKRERCSSVSKEIDGYLLD
jgi:hypothetical protein